MKYDICVIDYFVEDFLNSMNGDIYFKKYNEPINALGHGQAIVDIIWNICDSIKVCCIPIGKNATLHDIYKYLYFIMVNKLAKVINISFGFSCKNSGYKYAFDLLCKYMSENGFTIVCAGNICNYNLIPANCTGVYTVYENEKEDFNFKYYVFCGNKIFFNHFDIKVYWLSKYYMWVSGTSYYAGIVSALIAKDIVISEIISNNKLGRLEIRKII